MLNPLAANGNWGVSDLRDVIGINRALNGRLSDEADIIRYHADPPAIFKRISEHTELAVHSIQLPSWAHAFGCVACGDHWRPTPAAA